MSDQMSVVTLIRIKLVFQVKLQVKGSVHSRLTLNYWTNWSFQLERWTIPWFYKIYDKYGTMSNTGMVDISVFKFL